MHERIKRPSPATVLSMLALFVALSGSSYAAIKANAVGAKQIKANAVRTAELKDGGVGTADLGDNSVNRSELGNDAVGSTEVANEALNGGDIGDGSLTGDDISDESLTGGDVQDGSLGGGEIGDGTIAGADVEDRSIGTNDVDGLTGSDFANGELPPQAYARVQDNGTVQPDVAGFPPQAFGLDNTSIVKGEGGANTGTYCFDTPFRPASAMVSLDNADAAAADRNLVASVAIDRGEDLGDCPATHNDARVRIVDTDDAETVKNARFFIWFIR